MTSNLEQKSADNKSDELAQKLNEIMEFVITAAENGVSADAVERKLWSRVLEIGHQSMGMYFDLCGDGDMGERMLFS